MMGKMFVRLSLFLVMGITATILPAHAQERTVMQEVIASRLIFSEFFTACVKTNADPLAVRSLASERGWQASSQGGLSSGLLHDPADEYSVWRYTMRSSSSTSSGSTDKLQVFVPTDRSAKCGLEFERLSFGSVVNALEATGFELKEEVEPPRGSTLEQAIYCREKGYRAPEECITLATRGQGRLQVGQLWYVKPRGE